MIFVFDTSSLIKLKHFYPNIFESIWKGLGNMVASNNLISTREVWRELEGQDQGRHVNQWVKDNKSIFTTPQPEELNFVAEIFRVRHFHTLIGDQQRLKGTPVADPFVIACAKVNNGTVVTEEVIKPNAAKIPNVCQKFDVDCINLHQFMEMQNWKF